MDTRLVILKHLKGDIGIISRSPNLPTGRAAYAAVLLRDETAAGYKISIEDWLVRIASRDIVTTNIMTQYRTKSPTRMVLTPYHVTAE